MPCLQPFRGDTSQMLLFKIASCLEASGAAGGGVTSFNGFTGAILGVSSFNSQIGDVVLTLADISTLVDGRYVLKTGDTMTGPLNMTAGQSYQYNGVNVIRAQTALNNYFFGPSGNLTMTGTDNIAAGVQALSANTTGSFNLAQGSRALFSNTTGVSNNASGYQALNSNTTGSGNVASGYQALFSATTADGNVAFGVQALFSATTGGSNMANGYLALFSTTTGSFNVASGVQALFSNTTGGFNVAVGYLALRDLTTPATGQNTAIGYNTGRGITTGNNNTIIGANVTGLAAALSNNIIIADGAGNQRIQVGSTGIVTIPIALTLSTAAPLSMASGANQRAGDAVLVAGTVTVANTTVTANTRVFVSRKTNGGTPGTSFTYTLIAATSFTITSNNAADTSTVSYLLIEVP